MVKKGKLTTVVFCVFLAGLLAWHIGLPDKDRSETENRTLAQFPEFSWENLKNGSFTAGMEDYFADQFPLRDDWTGLKARCEQLLGKREFNGVYLCGDTLIAKVDEPDRLQMEKNLDDVKRFGEASHGRVLLGLIPSAAEVWKDRLPQGSPSFNQAAFIQSAAEKTGLPTVDLLGALTEHTGEPIYYRTDHHWTTDGGAYLAYQEYCRSLGLTPMEVSAGDFGQVPDFYGTTYSKCLRWDQTPDTISYLDIPDQMTVWKTNARGEATEPQFTSGLYEMEKAGTADKYSMFLYGNQGYVTIEGRGEGRVLVVKDSYANSFVPYLIENYAEICVIDPRSYRNSIDALMQREQFDQVLLLFSFQTYSTTNISSYLAASAGEG